MHRTTLVAFDFDHTVCDDNTDVVVRRLLPDERIPEDVRGLYKSSGWIAYMGRIFELLRKNSINRRRIESAIVGIPAVAGMEKLLTTLHTNGHEIVIVSDSNSVFIDSWLRSKGLERVVSRVFTNPAWFDDDGTMRVGMYHQQHTCQLSSVNLCKGQILMDYIEERRDQGKRFDRIIYVGDGKNDLCPILRLSEADLACPRKNYALIETLSKLSRDASTKAKIVPWKDGRDLQRSLEQIIKLR